MTSSRKLAAIFYFRDMTVLKVMFTALITAMLGLSLVVTLGFVDLESGEEVVTQPWIIGREYRERLEANYSRATNTFELIEFD